MINAIPSLDLVSGETVYRIPLSNRPGRYATVCEEGLAIIEANAIKSIFMSADGSRKYDYVSFYDPGSAGEMATLARLFVGAGRGQRVRYQDGDRTNLRLSNLRVERGAAKGTTPNHRLLGGAA